MRVKADIERYEKEGLFGFAVLDPAVYDGTFLIVGFLLYGIRFSWVK